MDRVVKAFVFAILPSKVSIVNIQKTLLLLKIQRV